MKSSMKAPQKTKNKTNILSSNTTLKHISEVCQSGYNTDTFTPMFIAALFTVTKICK
jgi:hypothetical protein